MGKLKNWVADKIYDLYQHSVIERGEIHNRVVNSLINGEKNKYTKRIKSIMNEDLKKLNMERDVDDYGEHIIGETIVKTKEDIHIESVKILTDTETFDIDPEKWLHKLLSDGIYSSTINVTTDKRHFVVKLSDISVFKYDEEEANFYVNYDIVWITLRIFYKLSDEKIVKLISHAINRENIDTTDEKNGTLYLNLWGKIKEVKQVTYYTEVFNSMCNEKTFTVDPKTENA